MDLISVRIDKWLWAARLFKTRTVASEACRAGHVQINGQRIKPSRCVKANEIISARTGPVTRTVRVTALLDHRVGASLVRQFYEDLTPASEFEKLKDEKRKPLFKDRNRLGRPTKKDRRAMGRILAPEGFDL